MWFLFRELSLHVYYLIYCLKIKNRMFFLTIKNDSFANGETLKIPVCCFMAKILYFIIIF